jgi:hypothetical protein
MEGEWYLYLPRHQTNLGSSPDQLFTPLHKVPKWNWRRRCSKKYGGTGVCSLTSAIKTICDDASLEEMLVSDPKVQIIPVGLDGVIPGYGKAWVWVRLGMRKCETMLIRAWSMTGSDSRLKRRSEGGKNNVRKIFYALRALFSDDGRIQVLHEAWR